MSNAFKTGAETFRAEVSEWLETEGYESAARVVGAWPLPEEQLPREGSGRLTDEEQADQDLAMRWANETIPSWRNTYDLIRRVRSEQTARIAAWVRLGRWHDPDSCAEGILATIRAGGGE